MSYFRTTKKLSTKERNYVNRIFKKVGIIECSGSSVLCKEEIIESVKNKQIILNPFLETNVGPDTFDVCLGPKLLIAKKTGNIIDIKNRNMEFEEYDISNKYYDMKPSDFILGCTLESIGLSNEIVGMIEGRSSLARIGLSVHQTASILHAGWGYSNPCKITLELSSVNPDQIRIYSGMKIGQIMFMRLGQNVLVGYDDVCDSKYKNLEGPLPSKINEDYKKNL